MNRLDDSKKYYYQCEKAKIIDKYTDLLTSLNIDNTNMINGELLVILLKNWFDYLIEIWHNEVI